jgi:Flp pilus assembly protein TadD
MQALTRRQRRFPFMSSLLFWKEWSRSYRLLYLFGLGLTILAFSLFIFAWSRGLQNVIDWNVLSELIDLPITLDSFSDGLINYSVSGKAYVISEQFLASPMQVHPTMATGLLAGLGIAFVLIMSAITRFDRLRYLVSMAVLILGMAFFRWEMLELPGLGGNSLFLLLLFLFGSLSYYFHAFRPDIEIPVRIGLFTLLTGLSALCLSILSPVTYPALLIVSYGMPTLLAFSVGFIFFIAPEVIAGLVWLTSVGRQEDDDASSRRTLGFNNLLVISLLYLVNLTLIWLKNTRSIDWDLLAISPFVLYLITVILGFGGFRRLLQQQEVVSFRDAGAFLYLGLAIIATLTMAYSFVTANDPLVELFEDAIVYTQLAMGVFFLIYVVINFWPIYQQNLPVHRVLYKPKRLELILFRIMGVVGVAVLVSTGGLVALRQGVAGYFNGLGDLYTAMGERLSATAFYQKAVEQEFQNHKSNYALASEALKQGNQTTAAFYFQQALLKQPCPQDYAGLSQTYLQTDLFFEAIKALQRGVRAFPDNGELRNNLGYLYARTSVADSAYYYFKSAVGITHQDDVPESNLLGFYARNPKLLAADSSLVQQTRETMYESYQANALALRLIVGKNVTSTDANQPNRPAWFADTTAGSLGAGRFASLYNYALANQQADSSLTKTIQQYLADPINQELADDLLLARAVTDYKSHKPLAAFDVLEQLANDDQVSSSSYRSVAGLWLLEQGLYRQSAEMFGRNSDTTSIYYRAMALTKAAAENLAINTKTLEEARPFWVAASAKDPALESIRQVLYKERLPATDFERSFYVIYRLDDENRGRYWDMVKDPSQKTIAGVALMNDYLNQLQWRNAQLILSGLPDSSKISPIASSLQTVVAIRLAAFRRSVGAAERMAKREILPAFDAQRAYWLGQTYDRTRQFGKAMKAYEQAYAVAPLNASIVSATAQLLRQQKQTNKAYNIITAALPFNEDKPELLKTYVLLCLDCSLFEYAENGLTMLAVASPTDYQAFLATYQQKLTAVENSKAKFFE